MSKARINSARAVITFPAPHGTDSTLLSDGEVIEFGRGSTCGVRFAFAPVVDESVPRVAGRLVAASRRIFVEVEDAARRPSVQVCVDGRPTVMVGVGDGFAPAGSEFRVAVPGSHRLWSFTVRVRRERPAPTSGDVPTKTWDVTLTDVQRAIISAYVEPLRRGRWEPATHREVAAALSYHPSTVRDMLYNVWAELFAAGVPLPDIADKRMAVVEAVRLHRLMSG